MRSTLPLGKDVRYPMSPVSRPRRPNPLERLLQRIKHGNTAGFRLAMLCLAVFLLAQYFFGEFPSVLAPKKLQRIPITDDRIHYVGRWVLNDQKTAMETVYSGGYIDIRHNSTRITIRYSYYRQEKKSSDTSEIDEPIINLLIVLDDNRWIPISDAHGPITLDRDDYGLGYWQTTRLIFPRSDQDATVQFLGVDIDQDATLKPVPSRKLLEVITDTNFHGDFSVVEVNAKRELQGIMKTVVNWPYLLAQYFKCDVRIIGIDGACLQKDCIGMPADGEGIGRAYYRRVPSTFGNTTIRNRPWDFEIWPTPDAIITHFGHSNYIAEKLHPEENPSRNDDFMEAYRFFVLSLHRTAYPMATQFPSSCLDNFPCPYKKIKPQFAYKKHENRIIPIFMLQPPQASARTLVDMVYESIRDDIYEDPNPLVYRIHASTWLRKPLSMPFFYTRLIRSKAGGDREIFSWTLAPEGHQKMTEYLAEFLCPWLSDGKRRKCRYLRQRVPYEGHVWMDPEQYRKGRKEKPVWRRFEEEILRIMDDEKGV